MDHGVAYICCNVKDKYDVTSHYSVEGSEFISAEFAEHLDRIKDHVPNRYPMVLELNGTKFTDSEKESIGSAVWNHFELKPENNQQQIKRNLFRVGWFAIFFIAALFAVLNTSDNRSISELAYVVLYFYGGRMIDYAFLENYSLFRTRLGTAHKSSMKVKFYKSYNPRPLTGSEAEALK